MRAVKTKTLISVAVAAKLICVFVFAYADCWFSHEAAHILAHFCRQDIRLAHLLMHTNNISI